MRTCLILSEQLTKNEGYAGILGPFCCESNFAPFPLSRLRVPPAYALFTHEQRSKPLCRGFCLGSNWVAPAKAKNQLVKAVRKLGEDQMDRHRRESFAKVDD